jgi:hypothetical protein
VDVMEKTVEELRAAVPFKDTTETGDVVLMLNETEDPEMPVAAAYASITGFERDITKRDEWWHVHFAFLTIPPTPRSIILQPDHFTGQEIFTMGGKKVFIKALDMNELRPEPDEPDEESEDKKEKRRGGLRVVKG